VEIFSREKRKDFDVAREFKILESSPRRKVSPCPYFPLCGGCDFQHIDYEYERDIKRDIFFETFRRIGGIELSDVDLVFSEPAGYRHRVQLHKAPEGLGFREAGGSRIVTVKNCLVAVSEINGFLSSPPAGGIPNADRFVVFGAEGRRYLESASEDIVITLANTRLKFSPRCFFQSNLGLLEKLLGRLAEELSGTNLLDLYGGVGTFASLIGRRFSHVTLVEENPLSARYARLNLPIATSEVFSGKVESWLLRKTGPKAAYDTVIVDPPRKGLSPPVRGYLASEKPPHLVYVSCDVATLARDTAFLLQAGYSLTYCDIYDFYPRTAHMEALCRFSRA
jgi:23S rRNA (uracil1939-C5)-methyltransferase